MKETQTRSWAELDQVALRHNYQYLRSLAPNSRFLGLCKANAYGHDVSLIAPMLEAWGADMLAVATVEEGAELRKLGITCPILLLGNCPQGQIPHAVSLELTATIHHLEQGYFFQEVGKAQGKRISVHIKVDTGMGRLGFSCGNLPKVQEDIHRLLSLEFLQVEGLFSHFSSSEDPSREGYTQGQVEKFEILRQEFQGLIPLFHLANSGGVLYQPASHLDMIRPGIALYGYSPDGQAHPALQPVLQLKSRIAHLRPGKKGEEISYGGTAVLTRDSTLALLPLGYGDGYPRQCSGKMYVKIQGVPCPIVGNICMDMMMVDVTDVDTFVGDVATVYGEDLLLQCAQVSQNISYALLCQLTPRIPRMWA